MITDDERRRDVALGYAIRALGGPDPNGSLRVLLNAAAEIAAWLEHGGQSPAHRYRDEPPALVGPPEGYRPARIPTGEQRRIPGDHLRDIDATAIIGQVRP